MLLNHKYQIEIHVGEGRKLKHIEEVIFKGAEIKAGGRVNFLNFERVIPIRVKKKTIKYLSVPQSLVKVNYNVNIQ